jgi:hypothetical protein
MESCADARLALEGDSTNSDSHAYLVKPEVREIVPTLKRLLEES